MIIIKDACDIRGMRVAGHVAALIRDQVAAYVSPGITTGELAEYASELMRKHGAESAFLGYRGYPGAICVSVNEAVVHGIPGSKRIEMGDLVSIDIGVKLDGYLGDTATTVMVGVTDQEIIRLVRTTEKALEAGIDAARPGRKLSDISHAIEAVATDAGFSVVRDFVGHGIGKVMHEDPQIPNFGAPGRGPKLKPGMTFCLEPMVNAGGYKVDMHRDGWTVLTRDRRPSAHCEHMIAVTEEDAEILTV